MSEHCSISVVIIAKNAEETIGNTIDALFANTRKPDETIVVVDNFKDTTMPAVHEYPVIVLITNRDGVGSARKFGVETATGDVIVFVDADTVAHPRMLEEFERFFLARPSVDVQAGMVVNPGDEYDPAEDGEPAQLDFVETMRLAFRKRVIDVIGNFDEAFNIGGEDLDFCVRLRKSGIGIYENRRALLYHRSPGLASTLRKSIRNGKALAQVVSKHGFNQMKRVLMLLGHVGLLALSASLLLLGYYLLALIPVSLSLGHRTYRWLLQASSNWSKREVAVSLVDNYILTYMMYFSMAYGIMHHLVRGTARI